MSKPKRISWHDGNKSDLIFEEIHHNGMEDVDVDLEQPMLDDLRLDDELPPDDITKPYFVYSFDTSTELDKTITEHWYFAVKDLNVEPESDNARNLNHLIHLIKILQNEQIVVGPFKYLPSYSLRQKDFDSLKNYATITEDVLWEMIETERHNRFQRAVIAIQVQEGRPEEDWDSCYTFIEDDNLDHHYFHFPPQLLQKADTLLTTYGDVIKQRIRNVRNAKKISLDVPKSPSKWERYPEEYARLQMEQRLKENEDEATRFELQPVLHMCYLQTGTESDQRILLNWIAVAEDLPDSHTWKNSLVQVLGYLEEQRITIPPFDRMPQRPFPRGSLPYDFSFSPTMEEAVKYVAQTKTYRVRFISNLLYNNGQLRSLIPDYTEGDAVAFFHTVGSESYTVKHEQNSADVDQILQNSIPDMNNLMKAKRISPNALRYELKGLQETVLLPKSKKDMYSIPENLSLMRPEAPPKKPFKVHDRLLLGPEVSLAKYHAQHNFETARKRAQQAESIPIEARTGTPGKHFNLGISEREVEFLRSVTPMAKDILARSLLERGHRARFTSPGRQSQKDARIQGFSPMKTSSDAEHGQWATAPRHQYKVPVSPKSTHKVNPRSLLDEFETHSGLKEQSISLLGPESTRTIHSPSFTTSPDERTTTPKDQCMGPLGPKSPRTIHTASPKVRTASPGKVHLPDQTDQYAVSSPGKGLRFEPTAEQPIANQSFSDLSSPWTPPTSPRIFKSNKSREYEIPIDLDEYAVPPPRKGLPLSPSPKHRSAQNSSSRPTAEQPRANQIQIDTDEYAIPPPGKGLPLSPSPKHRSAQNSSFRPTSNQIPIDPDEYTIPPPGKGLPLSPSPKHRSAQNSSFRPTVEQPTSNQIQIDTDEYAIPPPGKGLPLSPSPKHRSAQNSSFRPTYNQIPIDPDEYTIPPPGKGLPLSPSPKHRSAQNSSFRPTSNQIPIDPDEYTIPPPGKGLPLSPSPKHRSAQNSSFRPTVEQPTSNQIQIDTDEYAIPPPGKGLPLSSSPKHRSAQNSSSRPTAEQPTANQNFFHRSSPRTPSSRIFNSNQSRGTNYDSTMSDYQTAYEEEISFGEQSSTFSEYKTPTGVSLGNEITETPKPVRRVTQRRRLHMSASPDRDSSGERVTPQTAYRTALESISAGPQSQYRDHGVHTSQAKREEDHFGIFTSLRPPLPPVITAEQIDSQFGILEKSADLDTSNQSRRQVDIEEKKQLMQGINEMDSQQIEKMVAEQSTQAQRILRDREKRRQRLKDPNYMDSNEEEVRQRTTQDTMPVKYHRQSQGQAAKNAMFGSQEETSHINPEKSRMILERRRLKKLGIDPDQEAKDAAYQAQRETAARDRHAAAAHKAAMQGTSLGFGGETHMEDTGAPKLTLAERKRLKQKEEDQKAFEMFLEAQKQAASIGQGTKARANQSSLGGYFGGDDMSIMQTNNASQQAREAYKRKQALKKNPYAKFSEEEPQTSTRSQPHTSPHSQSRTPPRPIIPTRPVTPEQQPVPERITPVTQYAPQVLSPRSLAIERKEQTIIEAMGALTETIKAIAQIATVNMAQKPCPQPPQYSQPTARAEMLLNLQQSPLRPEMSLDRQIASEFKQQLETVSGEPTIDFGTPLSRFDSGAVSRTLKETQGNVLRDVEGMIDFLKDSPRIQTDFENALH